MTVLPRKSHSLPDRMLMLLVLVSGAAIVIAAGIKAAVLPFTHDESLTYRLFVHLPVLDITGYVNTYGLPNNHILNTLLMKLCEALAGNSPFVLRLPNLAALLLYLYFGYRILEKTGSRVLVAAGFVLLGTNLFVNDFFSLARGYGIANAMLLGAVHFLFRYREKNTRKNLLLFFVFAGLCILANFTLLHASLSLVLLLFALRLPKEEAWRPAAIFRAGWPPLLFLAIMAGLLYEPFRTILKWKTTFGGTENFWKNSLSPLITDSIYTDRCFGQLPYVTMILVLAAGLIAAALLHAMKRKQPGYLAPLGVLLFLPVFLFHLQHWILGTEFPVSRTLQYLYPVLVLCLLFSIGELSGEKKALSWLAVVPGLVMLQHYARHWNNRYFSEWRIDSANYRVLDEIGRRDNTGGTKETAFYVHWLYEPGLRFEQERRGWNWLVIERSDSLRQDFRFYYVPAGDTSEMRAAGHRLLQAYPVSNSYLYTSQP